MLYTLNMNCNKASCKQGKGEMRTYWLVGEDPARRLARLRGQTVSSSAGIFSFDRE